MIWHPCWSWTRDCGSLPAPLETRFAVIRDSWSSLIRTATAAPPPGKPPGGAASGSPAGIIAWLSVSLAALSSGWAFVVNQLSDLDASQIWRGVGFVAAGILIAILVPVGIVALLKLRRQDLSSLLEGCGWAINARMRLTRSQRKHFTKRARF